MVKAIKNSEDIVDLNNRNNRNRNGKGNKNHSGKYKGNQSYNKNNSGEKGIKFVKGGDKKRRQPVDDNTKNLRRLYNKLMLKAGTGTTKSSKSSKSSKSATKEVNKPDIVKK